MTIINKLTRKLRLRKPKYGTIHPKIADYVSFKMLAANKKKNYVDFFNKLLSVYVNCRHKNHEATIADLFLFYLEVMDAHGGWIALAIDLMRFVTALDGSRPPSILKPESVNLMLSRPAPPLWVGSSYYYGMGLLIRPIDNDANCWHTGSLPGTTTILVRTNLGLSWAALFNSRPQDEGRFLGQLDAALWQATREVTKWPVHDLFSEYVSK